MGKNDIITALRLILNDVSENHVAYDGTKLEQLVSQFQGKILALRQKDHGIEEKLKDMSVNDLKQVIDEIDLCLLSLPAQKGKIVPLLNELILQEGKETQLLQVINKFNFLRTSFKKSVRHEKVALEITPENIDEIRSEWLADDSPEDLAYDMERLSLKNLRALTEPWKIKSKSKEGLIEATITYLKQLKK